jgi:predicted dehydrogenase
MEKVKVGIIGCGNIFSQYVKGCRAFEILEVDACADIIPDAAVAKAQEHHITRVLSIEELVNDPEIQIVVNLTIPQAHASVSLAAIAAGKHVYSEKPLAVTRVDGRQILTAASKQGVLVGCAPDTFLGGGLQTCRKLIDDGWIGEPVAAAAFMISHGPESWHPNPAIFYQRGAGPLFDMGPYYLTALIHLLGPVQRVTGSTRISFPERVATSQARYGERLTVEVTTHVTGVMDFVSGPIATLIITFDVWHSHLPRIEIYGTEGTLLVPDPNIFGGPVYLRRMGAAEWSELPLSHSADVGRGIGVADLAYAAVCGRPHRANGDMAYHVLEIMEAFEEASQNGRHVQIESRCKRPSLLPPSLLPGHLDA